MRPLCLAGTLAKLPLFKPLALLSPLVGFSLRIVVAGEQCKVAGELL